MAKSTDSQHNQITGSSEGEDAGDTSIAKEDIERITKLLLERTDRDFSGYKQSTLGRRIRRRMQLLKLDSLDSYVERLTSHDEEASLLVEQFLIGVTSFFRDPDTFEKLAEVVIPRIFDKDVIDVPVRIWVPACSTGEEAYSLAMLCAEHMDTLERRRAVQIFASDADPHAVSVARRGLYSERLTDELSQERLERFFHWTEDGYEVDPQLREMCLFSEHDLLADPVFSHLDLVSCRNLLIYLNPEVQKELLDRFHFALKPGGYLFLGSSETVSSNSELFVSCNDAQRIFQRTESNADAQKSFAGRLPVSLRTVPHVPAMGSDTYSQMQRIVLERYAPKSVVIDSERRVVCSSGETQRYLRLSRGSFENDILKMARSELRVGLRGALNTVYASGEKVVRDNLSVETDAGIQPVRISVEPLASSSSRKLYVVVFEDVGEPIDTRERTSASEDVDELIANLEQELNRAHQDLDETVRELEFSNEELRSSNEELRSLNEELQSSNEEMETAKEEVQSVNRALEQANTDLQNLLESTQIATIFLDRDMCIQRMTPAVRSIYNVKPSDVGRPLTDVTHLVEEMPPLPPLEEVDEATAPIEDELRTKDGHWFVRRVLPYRDSNNQKSGMVVTFVDNTERRKAQERASYLAAIVDSSQDAILAKTLDGVVTSWNTAAERMYGYTSEEMIGTHISIIFPDDRPHELESIMSRLRLGEVVEPYETRRVRKDGRLIDIALTVSPVLDSDGKVIGASAIARDISARIERERQLEERNRALHTLNQMNRALASSLDTENLLQQITNYGTELTEAEFGAFFYNLHDSLSYKLSAMSGLHEAQLAGMPMPRATEIFKPIFDGTGVERSDDITADPRFGKNPPYNGHPPGHPPVRSYLAAPVISRDGEVYGGLFFGHSEVGRFSEKSERLLVGLAAQASIALDNAALYEQLQKELRERRQTEERLEQAIVDAKAANESKSAFLANMSHEIRTPMTAILGYADVLMSHLNDPDNRQCVETIRRNGDYLLEIINDILDLSKIEAGKLEIERQRVAPDHLVAEVLSLMGIRAREKSLSLQVEFDSTLPETVETDPIRLRQVLVNLVSNAIKFTEEGHVTLRVGLLDDEPAKLQFEVLDTGVGMTIEEQETLFEPFAQGQPSNGAKHAGTGLGLPICARLVRMLGGEIAIESEPNVGTTVSFTIDTGSLDDVPMIHPSSGIARPSQPVSTSSIALDCRVLLADDRREIRFLAAHYLAEAGAKVETVANGQEAVAAVKEAAQGDAAFDIIILDMQMPVMDGYQATKKLRRMGYELPIIALTAAAMESDRARCLEAGCDDYVAKPIRADELAQLVDHHLGARANGQRVVPGLAESTGEETPAAPEVSEANEVSKASDESQIEEGARRILLVEDNADARQALEQLLGLVGNYEVQSAASGAEAVEIARQSTFDVVLLDLGLPDMSGYELLGQLQALEQSAETTFIALSGRSTPEEKQRSVDAGFAHHIVKPASIDELRKHLD